MNTKCYDGFRIKFENNFVWYAEREKDTHREKCCMKQKKELNANSNWRKGKKLKWREREKK